MEIERIKDGEIHLALIIRRSYRGDGIEFFTPSSYSQQIGYMNRPAGYIIQPHVHNPVMREVEYTNEQFQCRCLWLFEYPSPCRH